MRSAALAVLLLAGCLTPAAKAPLDPAWTRMDPTLAPEMGWNGWVYFGEKITPEVVLAAARSLAREGLRELGYVYVQLDGGWWTTTGSPGNGRDAAGRIVPDPEFSDMRGLVDAIHALGLKAGIYTDAGSSGCGTQHGSGGHYESDVAQFAEWGFDYVKLDWCGGERDGLDARTAYRDFRAALDANPAARHMRLNICEWGHRAPWTWGPAIGSSWRTGRDISPEWANWTNVLRNFDANDHPEAAGPGHWNDADHVIVGVWDGNLTFEESRAHFSMWAMQSAPLVLASNILVPTRETLDIVGNEEVILLDQDALGEQARRHPLRPAQGVETWVKNVTGGKAVMLLNRGDADRDVTIAWSDVGIAAPTRVRDVWAHADVPVGATASARVAAHGVVVWRVNGG